VALTTHLARTLGLIFLAESSSDPASQVEQPMAASAELASVALGRGLLVLEGSYVYSKSCGGPSVAQLTSLSVSELAVACALFVRSTGGSGRAALSALSTTQRALLSEAIDWAASNDDVLGRLATAPAEVEARLSELRDTRTWLSRLLDRRAKPADEPSLELALAGGLSTVELQRLSGRGEGVTPRRQLDPKRKEIRALVDEALGSS
jgi:hypothetical protein